MTDSKKTEHFTFDMTSTITLTLSLNTKKLQFFIKFDVKKGVNFQKKNVLDLHMTFNVHNDLAFELNHDFEGHMKVKNIFLKIYPHF